MSEKDIFEKLDMQLGASLDYAYFWIDYVKENIGKYENQATYGVKMANYWAGIAMGVVVSRSLMFGDGKQDSVEELLVEIEELEKEVAH